MLSDSEQPPPQKTVIALKIDWIADLYVRTARTAENSNFVGNSPSEGVNSEPD